MTANKREEVQQDTPDSLTFYKGEVLAKLGMKFHIVNTDLFSHELRITSNYDKYHNCLLSAYSCSKIDAHEVLPLLSESLGRFLSESRTISTMKVTDGSNILMEAKVNDNTKYRNQFYTC